MAERKVKFQKGSYYHIYNRGASRLPIFRSDENYRFLLRKLKKYTEQTKSTVIAYCLMPNHYHFLLRQDGDIPLNNCIQLIFNSYLKAFNKMHERSGTLFEERFRAVEVDSSEYAVHLCRYIHRNPLAAKLVDDLENWKYSNYLDWIEMRKGSLVDKQFIKTHFKNSDAYKDFVLNYKGKKKYVFQF